MFQNDFEYDKSYFNCLEITHKYCLKVYNKTKKFYKLNFKKLKNEN